MFYGLSGSGKTLSSLLIARGYVGPAGKIALIDTESSRGALYSDVVSGGYNTADLSSPFTPEKYVAMITAAEQEHDIIIVDSISHEWEGDGGILSQALAEEQRTGKPGLHCWAKPKLAHQKLILKLLQAKRPVICCLRAKYKSRQVKKNNKTEIVRDDHPSPIADEAFIYEATAHAEVMADHTLRITKCSHPDLRGCFDKNPATLETGAKIARWARGGSAPPPIDLRQVAEDVASLGTDRLKQHWKTLSLTDRRALESDEAYLEHLRKTAADADEERRPDPDRPDAGST